jgi:hypothetical protein
LVFAPPRSAILVWTGWISAFRNRYAALEGGLDLPQLMVEVTSSAAGY